MRKSEVCKSRRITPWDGDNELTPTQAFLKKNYDERYNSHHRTVEESGETNIVNSYIPVKCPFCDSEEFKKNGYTIIMKRKKYTAHISKKKPVNPARYGESARL